MNIFKTVLILFFAGIFFPLRNVAQNMVSLPLPNADKMFFYSKNDTQNIYDRSLFPGSGSGEEKETEKRWRDYLPEIHGTVRAKYEYQPQIEAGRFEVRNARVSLAGNVLPTAAYKAEIDLSDEGEIKMLDAYVRIFLSGNFDFTIGQMRVPFTIDAHRSPHLQYFANRSFIAKQVGNVRDVGATVTYHWQKGFPWKVEAGLFNGSGLTGQKEWRKSMNYSVKTQFPFTKDLNLALSAQTLKPDRVRIYMYDAGMYYEFGNFHVEGEYLYKHYEKKAFKKVHAVNAFVNYDWKLSKIFHKLSFLFRYDMMTDHSNGKGDQENKQLKTDDYGRHRITGGLTFSLGTAFQTDLRLNYEKYFYKRAGLAKESEQDKIVFEVMVRF